LSREIEKVKEPPQRVFELLTLESFDRLAVINLTSR
jgi:hypothetical protein